MARRTANPATLAANVRRIAALLGERTGQCAVCELPVRLTSHGLVPAHYLTARIGGRHCPGSDQQPAGDEDGDR